MTGRRVRDNEGDEWVEREDGWCCQAPCRTCDERVQHACDEHDHLPLAHVELWSPLAEVPS